MAARTSLIVIVVVVLMLFGMLGGWAVALDAISELETCAAGGGAT